MAKKDFDKEDGVWRTVGGRRIFIRNGQSLSDAMKESGKFSRVAKNQELYKKAEKESKEIEDKLKEKEETTKEKEKKINETMDKRASIINKLDEDTKNLEDYDKYNLAVSKLEQTEGMQPTERQYWVGVKERYEKQEKAREKEIDLSDKKEKDDYEYNLYKKARENEDSIDPMTENSTDWEALDEKYRDRYAKEQDAKSREEEPKEKEQFEVGDLKKKAMETLPKEDIDSHEGDLYIKKTKESEALLNNMKDKDSGLLTTFKDQQTGETWYDIPFANMGDDYKEKEENPSEAKYNDIEQEALDRFTEDYGWEGNDSLKNLREQIDYMRNPGDSIHRTAERLVEGGDYLIYNGDIQEWLDKHGIEYNEDNFFDKYKKTMADSIEKLYNQKEEKTTNETMNNAIREKTSVNKYEGTKRWGFGYANDDNIPVYQNKIDYSGDFTHANLSTVSDDELKQIGARQSELYNEAINRTTGDRRTYNGRMANIFKQTETLRYRNGIDKVTEEMEKRGIKPDNQINNALQLKAFEKYKKEHPRSKMTFENFKKQK